VLGTHALDAGKPFGQTRHRLAGRGQPLAGRVMVLPGASRSRQPGRHRVAGKGRLVAAQFRRERFERIAFRDQSLGGGFGGGEVSGEAGRLGFERSDHVRLCRGRERSGDGAAALGDDVRDTALTFEETFGSPEPIRSVPGLGLGEGRLRRSDQVVETRQLTTVTELPLSELGMRALGVLEPAAQPVELTTGQVQPERTQLGSEAVVAASRLRLALERPQLATDLTLEVLQPEQVLLAGLEATLGPLAPAAELENPGSLLDHHAPILRARLQHSVELALADDHVLLPADAGVGEQLLDVEQPAGRPVDRILALAGPKQRPRDRHLRHLHREAPGAVVDREGDLRPTEGGPLRGSGEDDVVHLRGPDHLRALSAEHPGHGIDDVRLAGPVRPDHHRDARLEVDRGRIGEGLESLQGQRLQEHGGLTLSVTERDIRD
jgi:hypothetical protein